MNGSKLSSFAHGPSNSLKQSNSPYILFSPCYEFLVCSIISHRRQLADFMLSWSTSFGECSVLDNVPFKMRCSEKQTNENHNNVPKCALTSHKYIELQGSFMIWLTKDLRGKTCYSKLVHSKLVVTISTALVFPQSVPPPLTWLTLNQDTNVISVQ